MKENPTKDFKMKLIFSLFFALTLTACSSQATNTPLSKSQTVETGTVVAVKSIYLKPEKLRPSVGVSIGSGGYRGVHGGVDVGNVVRVIRDANNPRFEQEIIIRKTNGDTVAITQISKEMFKKGDNVKLILIKNGEARVIR